MTRRLSRAVSLGPALCLLGGLAGCGPAPLAATFTSRVVQQNVCTVVGDRPEVCVEEDAIRDVRVRLVERDLDRVWLYGVPRAGVTDRAILGTRDREGGFLFIDEAIDERFGDDEDDTCTVTSRLTFALRIDDEAKADLVGDDPCVSLLGRETEVTTSSAGCDGVNDPPLPSVLTARRRWQPPPDCAP